MEEMQGRLEVSDGFGLFYRHWMPDGPVDRTVLCLHGMEVMARDMLEPLC